ncbi:GTP-binding protein [Cupriavidus respiraculi]|uniref:P-loop guanosine triphosphatase YjiA n=1 Tax=Cupriavidus respiraculi TaxID=195930 RepID=A0ABN7YQV6_9BURK|nr:GTP-binding protein [Cupriavidus respiraculi]CAG9175843.1 P-loop guanosine triphosphatase YjiA [Cupriavidus respiraculi]
MSKLIPVTILTGFLGSGKTTLLKRILNEQHGMKIAVIENEFGEENIDNEILVQDGREQIVQMSNGCICCTIRGDLVQALSDLIARRDAGELDFDRVVIETTGVANPGPVAQTFFMDDEIATRYLLDAVITLVDAKHGNMQLDKQEEAQRQVGFADAIFITKSDLVTPDDVAALRHRLLHMNPRAPIATANFGEAPIESIFDLRGFNLNAKLELDPEFLSIDEHEHGHDHAHGDHCADDCGHDHDHGHGHAHDHHHHHHHTDRIASFVFRSDKPFHYARLEEFLSGILSVYGEKLLRYKGVLYMEGVDRKVVFQGVHQLMGSDIAGKWEDETPGTRMVFIGVDLPRDAILKGLANCLA